MITLDLKEIAKIVEPFCKDSTGVFLENNKVVVRFCGEVIEEMEIGKDLTLSKLGELMVAKTFISFIDNRRKIIEITLQKYFEIVEEYSNYWGE